MPNFDSKQRRSQLHHFRRVVKSSRLRNILVVVVAVAAGYAGIRATQAATFAVSSEAESGTITGSAAPTNDQTASGKNSVVFGLGSTPSVPTGLKTFTGGMSIALRWDKSAIANGTIKQYNIYRNNVQIATVTPGFHADFPEKDGNGYIDSSVTRGTLYNYQVLAVSSTNVQSLRSATVSATHPTNTTAIPNITYNLNGATDLDDYMKNTVVPFLKIWYPKIADYEAYPNYTPYNSFNITLANNYANILDTRQSDGSIVADTAFVRGGYQTTDRILGAWLHEATHVIQGQASTAGNNANTMAIEGGADFTRYYILHSNDPIMPSPATHRYYTDGYNEASYFINYVQQHYDPNYLRKITVDGHNNVFSAADVTFSNGSKNVDEVWAEMMGQPSHTGPFKSAANPNLCIDDQNSALRDTNPMQVYTCNGGNQQKVTAQPRSPSKVSLFVLGYCLDIANAGATDGTHVWLYDCNGGAEQQWTINANGTIVDPNSGKCLEVIGGNAGVTAGKGLDISTCTGAAWQKWSFPAGTPTQ